MTAAAGAALAAALALGACGPATAPVTPTPPPTPTPTLSPTQPPTPATPTPPATTPTPSHRPGQTATACDEPGGCFAPPRRGGTFDAAVVAGASGLAASRRNPGLLWLLDDRRGTSGVWVLEAGGALLGAVAVEGLDAADTEDLAVGPCGGALAETCVYVGDIGDNRRTRDHVAVHRFVEPDLSGGLPAAPVTAAVARLRYPDGPQDAEALLVDDDGVPLVVTKAPFDRATGTTGPTRLYRAPGFADGTLVDLGTVPVPPPPQPLHSQFVGNVVTGGDHLDGRVLLRTYDQALLYTAGDRPRDPATFPSWPVRAVPAALEPQSEAIAWAAPGGAGDCGYFTAGEQVGEVWLVACRP